MYCRFEEKQYENALNEELMDRRRLSPIGQVLEGRGAGIDAGMYSRHQVFWDWFGARPKGVHPWEVMEGIIDKADAPRFRMNLFIQHKRPEYIRSHRANEYHQWKKPYFRYDVMNREQQEALCRLERGVGRNAVVVYASAAFWKHSQLWHHYGRGALVENSNFVEPLKLQRHHRYTYVSGGRSGYAFSAEPERIDSFDLLEEVGNRLGVPYEFESNTSFIYSLSRVIKDVLKDTSDEFQRSHRIVVERRMRTEMEFGIELETILAFVIVADIRWSIALESP